MCSLHLVLRSVHNAFPYKLFKAFEGGWDEILAAPRCQHDELARAFLEKFHCSREELGSPLSLALLEALAAEFCTDIGAIEAKHSKNRDISRLRASAWTPSLAFMSAKFMARQLAKSARKVVHRKSQAQNKGARKKQRAKGSPGGGAWRAFVHERLAGQPFTKASMKECAQQYRALCPEEKEHYKHIGALGTIANRHGHASFGVKAKVRAKGKVEAADRFLPGTIDERTGAIILADAEEEAEDALVLDNFCAGKPFPQELQEFKEELNADIRARAQKNKSGPLPNDVLAAFDAAASSSSASLITACAAGGLGAFSSSEWIPVPGNHGVQRFEWNLPASKFSEARMWKALAAIAEL